MFSWYQRAGAAAAARHQYFVVSGRYDSEKRSQMT